MDGEDLTKFPPLLKIRGLLHRNGTEAKDNELKYHEFISQTKNSTLSDSSLS